MNTTTLSPEQIKSAIDETVHEMECFALGMGYDDLTEYGDTVWTCDGVDYWVRVSGFGGPTISTNVYHEGEGDALAEVAMRLNHDGSLHDDALYLYVDLPDEFI